MSNDKKFYEVSGARAVGYLNRITTIAGKDGKPDSLVVSIGALRGGEDNVSTITVDAFVRGEENQKLISRCKDAIEAKEKVLITFKLGDIRPDSYTIKDGDNAGEQRLILKGSIFYVGSIRKNGEVVYEAPKKDQNQQADA